MKRMDVAAIRQRLVKGPVIILPFLCHVMTLRARRGGPAGRSFGRIAPVVRCGWRAPANARLALRLEPRLATKVEAPPADVVIAVEVRPPPGNHVAVGGEGADPVAQIVDAADRKSTRLNSMH